jgi:hypothetical protein
MSTYTPGTKVVIEYDFSKFLPFLKKPSIVKTTGIVVQQEGKFVVVRVSCNIGNTSVMGPIKIPVRCIKSKKVN